MASQIIGLRFCGILLLPTFPGSNGSATSPISNFCNSMISWAIFPHVAAINISTRANSAKLSCDVNTDGRAKDQNASLIDNPTAIFNDTGRAVFSVELLRRVAVVQEKRSETKRPRGSVRKAHPFMLARLLYCAHCERAAEQQQDPRLRTRLSGHNKRGELRYRHAEGVTCGSHTRSVRIGIIEQELRLLIEQLTLKEESFQMFVELAIQSEHGDGMHNADLEKEKEKAIAKSRRRIEAAKSVFLDGDMSREEYAKIKEANEREIAHWQARTSETQKASVELRMCLNIVNQIIELWESSRDEDRQQMAHMLFEYIVYDLDRRQIVDFRLKAWADRYLVLRTSLYGDDDLPSNQGENQKGTSLKESTDLCPIGDSNSCFSLERATS